MSEQMLIGEAYGKIAEWAVANGAKGEPTVWARDLDKRWHVVVNRCPTTQAYERDGLMGISQLEPYQAAVFFNGWLAGLLSPFDGEFAAGSGANEDSFIEALDKAIAEATS